MDQFGCGQISKRYQSTFLQRGRKEELSMNAIALINSKFKWESIAKNFVSMYETE